MNIDLTQQLLLVARDKGATGIVNIELKEKHIEYLSDFRNTYLFYYFFVAET